MATVNINDRASVEAIYTVNTFEHDAARNARGEAAVLHGLKILSEADADGNMDLLPAAQHVAERDPEGDSIFLVPQLSTAGATYLDGAYGGSAAPTDDGIIAKGGRLPSLYRRGYRNRAHGRFQSAGGTRRRASQRLPRRLN